MSEITLFKNGGVVPGYIRNVESKLKDLTFAGAGGRNISIRGSVWRLMVDGKETAKSDDRTMKVVIVGMSEAVGRVHYSGQYEEGKEAAPICWSADGKIPDIRSAAVQASACDDCPKNIGGSGQGDSKACRYIRNLAVVMADDMGGDVYKLSLPATSLFGAAEGKKMSLDAYRRFLKGHGIPLDCVVTELRFDTDSSTPKVIFSAVAPLEKDEFDICQERAETAEAQQATVIEYQAKTPEKASSEFSSKQANKVAAKPAAKPKVEPKPEPEAEPEQSAEAEVLDKEEPVKAGKKYDSGFKASTADNGFSDVDHVDVNAAAEAEPEPVRRTTKKVETVSATPDVSSVLDKWADDDED
jgi:hypothetical protein